MSKVWGCITVPKLQLNDLDTDKYKCIGVVNTEELMAVALMSEASDPPHYRVICGTHRLVFSNRKDALECLEQFKNNSKNVERGKTDDY